MCVIQQYFVLIPQTVAEIRWSFAFSKWRPSAILDLLCACWDYAQNVFGGIYHCAKFGWNRCSSFDKMLVLIFNEFGLKMPIHSQNRGFWGIWPPKWGAVTLRPPKDTSLHRNIIQCTDHPDWSISFCTAHHFTRTSKSYALQCFSMGETPLKMAPSLVGTWIPYNTCFLGPTRVYKLNSISIGSAVFAGITIDVA